MNARDKKVIISAAKAGGKVVKSYFGKVLNVEEKSCAWDYRTQADVESEAAILKILEKDFPTYNIVSEECGLIDKKSDYTFYVDPLDGTNNFVLGVPNFSVLISLARGKEAIFGLVYLPMLDLCYWAEKGKGAFCGRNRLQLSLETSMEKVTMAYACAYKTPKEEVMRVVSNIELKGDPKRLLFSWSPAVDFCLLASGKIETIFNDKTEIHDFLGAKLILREAGCVITDTKGKPDVDDFCPTFLASNNKSIHKKVLSLI
ncbi:MAG: inositol monophosphatase [Patescibacteria group bacterium]